MEILLSMDIHAQTRLKGHLAAYLLCPRIGAYVTDVAEHTQHIFSQNPALLMMPQNVIDDSVLWNTFTSILSSELANMRASMNKKVLFILSEHLRSLFLLQIKESVSKKWDIYKLTLNLMAHNAKMTAEHFGRIAFLVSVNYSQ